LPVLSILLCVGVIAFVNHRTHARLEAARGDGADSGAGAAPTLASLQENPAALQIQSLRPAEKLAELP